MSQQFITGISVGRTPVPPDYDLIQTAGVEWLRFGPGFSLFAPDGTLHPRFVESLEQAQMLRDRGFKLLGSIPGPGVMRYNDEAGATIWNPNLPEWAGTHEEERYYETVFRAAAASTRVCTGLIGMWQIANEPDIDIFRGPLSEEQMIRFLFSAAQGAKEGNPGAETGINLGFLTEESEKLIRALYLREDCPFDYVGIDGYFGSWQPGGPEDWRKYIDTVYEITGKPILIKEWGYSSTGNTPGGSPDPERFYNQDVCRNGKWQFVWKKEHSPEEQAEYIRECVALFREHPRVIGHFFFKWSDDPNCWQCGGAGCPAECSWGLVDTAGKPKPAYQAFREAVKGLSPRKNSL